MKFTEKLLAFWVVLVILPAVLLGVSVFQRSIKAEKEAATSRRLVLVQSLANEFNAHFEEVKATLEVLTELYPKVGAELLSAFHRKISLIKSITFLSREGKPFLIAPAGAKLETADNTRALYFTEPVASGSVFLPDIFGDSIVFMSLPIRSPRGSIEAVLVCEFDLAPIKQRLTEITGSLKNSSVFFVDKHGNTIPRITNTAHPLVAKIVSGTRQWAGPYSSGQVLMFGASAPIPAAGWWIVIEQPYSQVFTRVNNLGTAGILILVISLVGLIFIGFLGTVLFTPPITRLTQATRELAEGKYDARVDITTSDEFGQLGRVFNRMAERIKAYFSVSQVLTQSLDAESLARDIVNIILEEANYRYAAVFLRKSETEELTLAAIQPEGSSFEFDNELRNGVLNTGKFYSSARGVMIPITGRNRIYGLLEVASQEADEIDGETVKGFEQIARQLALALANADLYNQVAKRADEQAALYSITRIASQSLKPDEILRLVMAEVLRETKHEVGSVYLWDEARQELVLKWHRGLPVNFVEKVSRMKKGGNYKDSPLRTGKVLVVEEIQNAPFINQSIAKALNIRSGAFIPLKIKGEIVGAMIVACRCARRFESADVKLLTAVGEEIGIALSNAQLYAEIAQRLTELQSIQKLGTELSQELEENKVVKLVTNQALILTGATSAWINLVTPDRKRRIHLGCVGEGTSKLEGKVIQINDNLQDLVIKKGEPIISNDVPNDKRAIKSIVDDLDVRNTIIVPLRVKNQTIGCLTVFNQKINRPFTTHQFRLLTIFANQAAIAIENARFFTEEQKRIHHLATISQVSQEITALLNLDDLLPKIVTMVQARFNNYCTYILFVEGDMVVGKAIATPSKMTARQTDIVLNKLRLPIDENSINGWVVRTGDPLLVNDVRHDSRFCRLDESEESRSELVAPIRLEGKTIGTLGFQSDKLNAFDETDRWTLQTLADQVAVVIKNARLYEQTVALKKLTDSVIGNLTSGVSYVDKEGKVAIFNRAMEEMFGVTATELVCRSPCVVMEALDMSSCPFKQVLESGKPLVYHETKLRRTDGTQLTIGMSITSLKDETKRIIGAVGVFVDLTALKAIEGEQQQIRDLALLGGTVTRIAHEIKNPLASILSGIQLLQRRLEPKKEQLEYLETIVGEIRRLDSSLKELLVFSKPQESRFILESPLVPLETALKFLEPQFTEQRITVVRDFDSSLPPVRIDPQKMEQVFFNLILNAAQSSDKGSEIRVSAKAQSDNNFSVVRYEITDFGSGIPKENLDRIFDPFFSTKTHGIGLGLPVVRRIVEEHGGTIAVKSKPGKDTTFIVRLTTEKV